MFASMRRAWMRAFYPQPAPAPEPIRFNLPVHRLSLLHIVITGDAGGGKSQLALQIWSALDDQARARTYIETGYHAGAVEEEFRGRYVTTERARTKHGSKRTPCLREGVR